MVAGAKLLANDGNENRRNYQRKMHLLIMCVGDSGREREREREQMHFSIMVSSISSDQNNSPTPVIALWLIDLGPGL